MDGEKGGWGGGGISGGHWVGEREIIYLSLHCHHQNDSCIKMGSDESHFNVSVGSDGQSHKTVSRGTDKLFEDWETEESRPKRYRTEVLPLSTSLTQLPLGQTGSLVKLDWHHPIGPCHRKRFQHRFPAPSRSTELKDVVNPCLEFASPTDWLVVTAAVRPQLSFSISVFFLKLVHSGLSSTSDSVVELVLVAF